MLTNVNTLLRRAAAPLFVGRHAIWRRAGRIFPLLLPFRAKRQTPNGDDGDDDGDGARRLPFWQGRAGQGRPDEDEHLASSPGGKKEGG